ncbi:MAG: hypothetical protein ACYDHY_15995 [Acidiferrobacterales bacterium]
MYQKYEVSPVVDTGGGSIASFLQYQDAAVLAGEKGKTVEMALYGIEDDGCRRHICDEGSSASMRTLLREMFGYAPDPDWAGDRIVFESPAYRATVFTRAVADMTKWGEMEEDGNLFQPSEGTDDSHICLMLRIDEAREVARNIAVPV